MSLTQQQFGARVTFRELFGRDQHGLVKIPIIQRDFAQGRKSQIEIRTAFLDAIFSALSREPNDPSLPLDLDFVYGSIEENGVSTFCPLDGQQRLTTLFLLHWYLGMADSKFDEFSSFMTLNKKSRFTYAVRPSSREFFDELANWSPVIDWAQSYDSISAVIEDQPWFFQWWKRDPTIHSALNMLVTIHEKFKDSKGFFNRIVQIDHPYITFQLLDLANFGLSDDLYIKMNARGKPLTPFEVFKARVEGHIQELFAGETRNLNGVDVDFKYYFSHQIDTIWADLFWNYRDSDNLFDDEVMNLVRALGIVTRIPESETFDADVEALRSSDNFSFQKYLELGCLDQAHLELLVILLDHLSGAAVGVRTYMTGSGAYKEEEAFTGILKDGERSSYRALLQFYAYAGFVRLNQSSLPVERLEEWMRVICNLTINSNIERPEEFKNSLRSINILLQHSGDVLTYLSNQGTKIQGFSQQQIQEERLKASLILKKSQWKDAIIEAESHGYFNGQIEFLLDFCGALKEFRSDATCGWAETEDREYLKKFSTYFNKAALIFDKNGLKPFGEFRTERALLAIGNYMFDKGQNRSFLENSEGPMSWKLLLRGEQLNNPGHRRGYLKSLLDRIDHLKGAEASFDEIIQTTVPDERWRQFLTANHTLIAFCEKRQIRYIDSEGVYLLKRLRRSAEHVELFSYHLYTSSLLRKHANGQLFPFNRPRYDSASTDWWEPKIALDCTVKGKKFGTSIWNYGISKFRFSILTSDLDLRGSLTKTLRGTVEKGEVIVDIELDLGRAEELIVKIAKYLKKHIEKE